MNRILFDWKKCEREKQSQLCVEYEDDDSNRRATRKKYLNKVAEHAERGTEYKTHSIYRLLLYAKSGVLKSVRSTNTKSVPQKTH